MLPVTLELPDELAERLRPVASDLPRILEMGLRHYDAEASCEFDGTADVFEFLAKLPAPEEILQLRPTPGMQSRIAELLERKRAGSLTDTEELEWRRYEYLEHLVRVAKATAKRKLEGK